MASENSAKISSSQRAVKVRTDVAEALVYQFYFLQARLERRQTGEHELPASESEIRMLRMLADQIRKDYPLGESLDSFGVLPIPGNWPAKNVPQKGSLLSSLKVVGGNDDKNAS